MPWWFDMTQHVACTKLSLTLSLQVSCNEWQGTTAIVFLDEIFLPEYYRIKNKLSKYYISEIIYPKCCISISCGIKKSFTSRQL